MAAWSPRARTSSCARSTTPRCRCCLETMAWCGYLSSARASSHSRHLLRSCACMRLHAITQRALSRVWSRRGAAGRWWGNLSALSRPTSTCCGTLSSGARATRRFAPRSPTPPGTAQSRYRTTPAATSGCATSATLRSWWLSRIQTLLITLHTSVSACSSTTLGLSKRAAFSLGRSTCANSPTRQLASVQRTLLRSITPRRPWL